MVHFVALAQPPQDRDGVLLVRLLDQHFLEAPLQRGVLLDVLAVLVQRGRAHAVQFAARERGLQHVARIQRTLGLAGADHGVQLVDEEDHAPFLAPDLLQHGLQPLLEIAAVLGTGEQRAEVQRQQPAVLQPFGHLAVDDALRQALDDRGLAHAGLADQHRVVLGAPLQHLDGAADLVVAPDHRVELALDGALGDVDRVFIERLARALGFGIVHALASAHLVDRLFQRPTLQPGELQRLAHTAAVLERR